MDISQNGPVSDLLWGKMEKELGAFCTSSPGVLGYHLLEVQSGKRVGFSDGAVFPTASTIKILILLGLSLRVHSGQLRWEDKVLVEKGKKVGGSGILTWLKYPLEISLWDLASFMIALSDNTATNICIELADISYINKVAQKLGLENTEIKRPMMDYAAAKSGAENVSTPRDLVTLLKRILEKDGVQEKAAGDVLRILELPKGGPFAKGLPEKVRRANKPGGLGNLSVDAGIIYLGEKTFILSVMGAFLGENPEEHTASFVKSAYRYMEVLNCCTSLGRS